MQNTDYGIFSDGSKLFVSTQNPKLGETVKIRIRLFSETKIDKIMFVVLRNGEEWALPMEYERTGGNFDYYVIEHKIIHHITGYHFYLIKDGVVWLYNQRGLDKHFSLKRWEFVIQAENTIPNWISDAVFYQIFPDRFYNGDESNDVYDGEYEHNGFKSKKKKWSEKPSLYKEHGLLDFFGGDLDGITQKLDYLQGLGVTALYLNPIFTAYTNHKYDCIDYFNVDKHFGGNDALVRLSNELHKRGMKIVLDISINHLGKRHPWTKSKPEYFFYDQNGKRGCWNDHTDLPTLNYNSDELKEVMITSENSAVKKWLLPPYNMDGWRFDVGQSTGIMNDSKIDHDIWRSVRNEIKSIKPEAYLFAEHWDDCIEYLQGDMWDATMNYYAFTRTMRKFLGDVDNFSEHKIKGAKLARGAEIFMQEVMEFHSLIPYTIRMSLFNLISSHDYPRIAAVNTREAILLAPMFMFMFPGVPCIYYGEEINLIGHTDHDSGFRYPMEWDEKKHDIEVFELYKSLISYRQKSDVLKHGSFKFLLAEGDTVCIARFDEETCVLFICSLANNQTELGVSLDTVGSYSKCNLVKAVGDANYQLENNKVNATFSAPSGIILELR